MKKISKLQLNKATVRNLTEKETEQVQGGAWTFLCPVKTAIGCGCIHTSAGPSHPIFC